MKFTEIDCVEGQMANNMGIPMVFQPWEYQGIMQEPCDLRAAILNQKSLLRAKIAAARWFCVMATVQQF